jgi:arylsulfatase A-like enzyme
VRSGYQAAAFYSNPWLSDRTTGLLRGFVVKEEAPVRGGLRGDPGRYPGDQGGRASVRFLRDWLQKRAVEAPFFVFVNFLEAHLPYDPPPEVRRQRLGHLTGGDRVSAEWGMQYQAGLHPYASVDWKRVRDIYGGDVFTADMLLAQLVEVLKEFDLYEQTVLVVTSDHGENLGDHQLVDHQFSVHETLLAVPLIIRAPSFLLPGQRTHPVMLTDLFATLVEVAGLKRVQIPQHSRSLLSEPAPADRPLVAEYYRPQANLLQSLKLLNPGLDISTVDRALRTVRQGDLRLTVASDDTAELHDLELDPVQEENLLEQRPKEAAALRTLLDRLVPETSQATEKLELDAEALEKLRSLGYVR